MSKIRITLESDLCCAGGDGFASVIDTDVSYDKYGLPFIGARRLKGCLRDCAKLIGSEKIDGIFGISGNDQPGSLKISDAVIDDYENIRDEIIRRKLNTEEIISLFTYTKASTAIENDTAKDDSLRFTRVVKQYSPLNNKKMVFVANVEIDECYKEELSDICSVLHNIGYKRNRGYGAISCEFDGTDEKQKNLSFEDNLDGDVVLKYTIKLTSAMMLPGSSSDETMDYIPGTAVLGCFASRYLRNGKSAESEEFENLFLKNNVKFSNLYISDSKGTEFFPAPVILGKIKGESGVFNIVTTKNEDGKIIKPVKTGYYSKNVGMAKPLTETVYHHTKVETKDEKSQLYTQTCISDNQYFSGTISGKSEYIQIIAKLFGDGNLRLGRSKTAQYSTCKVVKINIEKCNDQEKQKINEGETFIALLCSDVLIPDDCGGYDISAQGLINALDIDYKECDKDSDVKRSALRYRVIKGYHSKQNMQKSHIRTIAGGTTLVFKAEKGEDLPSVKYIGAKQNEGFGKVMFMNVDYFSDKTEKIQEKDETQSENNSLISNLIKKNKQMEEMRNDAISFVANMNKTIESSQIGRYALMLEFSENFAEFEAKTEKIKKDSSRNFIKKNIIETVESRKYKDTDLWKEYFSLVFTLLKYKVRQGKAVNADE